MINKTLITLLVLGSGVANSLSSYADTSLINKTDVFVNVPDSETPSTSKVLKLPQTKKLYKWTDNLWDLCEDHRMTWNNINKIAEEDITEYENGELLGTKHYIDEYNEDGNISKSIMQTRYNDSDPWTNESMYTYKYDDVTTSFPILEEYFQWNWMFDEWEANYGYGYYYDILRDDNGRVVSITKHESKNTNLTYEALYFEYDSPTGPANRIFVERMDEYYDLVPSECYDNIKWQVSNCNYINYKDSRYYMWTEDPENLMLSATLYTYDEYGDMVYNSNLNFTYEEGKKKTFSIFSNDGIHIMNAYEYDTTPNGGYTYYYFLWNDLNNNKKFDKGEEVMNHKFESVSHEFDEYNNEVLIESVLYNEKTSAFDKLKYRKSYDIEYFDGANIKQSVYTHINKNEEIVTKEKWVYDDFIDAVPTSVKKVETDNNVKVCNGYIQVANNEKYVITDMQGRIVRYGVSDASKISLDSLSPGIYIVSVNNQQIKIQR